MEVKSESEVAQSCLTLRDPMDGSLPGSSVHGIFQAEVLEWVAIAFSGLYYIVVVFAIHWHESAVGIHVALSWIPLPPLSPSHPSGLSQCTSCECPVSCIEPGLAMYFTYDSIHISMLFSQIIPPLPFPTKSKSLFFTSVSLAISHIGWLLPSF